jgi:hypothetical protein
MFSNALLQITKYNFHELYSHSRWIVSDFSFIDAKLNPNVWGNVNIQIINQVLLRTKQDKKTERKKDAYGATIDQFCCWCTLPRYKWKKHQYYIVNRYCCIILVSLSTSFWRTHATIHLPAPTSSRIFSNSSLAKIRSFIFIVNIATCWNVRFPFRYWLTRCRIVVSRSSQVSSKFGVYKFLVFSEILVHSFKPPILDYTNRECQPCWVGWWCSRKASAQLRARISLKTRSL